MNTGTTKQRAVRIINQLKNKYPDKKAYDLDGRGLHFVCELEPVDEHPEYDRAVEVIILSKPHKHHKLIQDYTVLSGTLKLHINNEVMVLHKGDKYTVHPGNTHWAESEGAECWVELYSEPGWTKEDHILVN